MNQTTKDAGSSELSNEQILLIAKSHFKIDHDTSERTINAYCDSVRAVITSYGLARSAHSEAAQAPINGIPATLRHDEGAIARCSYCGRYSLDPKTLSDRQPKCECGEKHGWSGSFVKPGPDAKWSGAAPAEQAELSTESVHNPVDRVTDEQIAHLWDCSEREGETILDGYAREIRFARALLASQPAVPQGWLPIETAPRDGSNILIRFGQDGVSQAKYVPGVPHPWKFIDTNDGITWLINGARDGEYGPSHWQPMPSSAIGEAVAFRQRVERLLVELHNEGRLSEGQCSKVLDIHRIEWRKIADDAALAAPQPTQPSQSAAERCDYCGNKLRADLACTARMCLHSITRDESAVVLDDERAAFEAWGNETFNYGFHPETVRGAGFCADPDYGHEGTQMAWEGWQARATSPQPVSQTRALTADDADMVWPQDDGEIMHHSLDDAVEYEINQAWPVEAPLEFTFQVAKRIPDVTIRVTEITENGHEWEIVAAAQPAPGADQ